jgi:hypothetical protein
MVRKFYLIYNNKNNYNGNELQRMWNTKHMIIPVISGTTGIATKDTCESHSRKTTNRFTTKDSYHGKYCSMKLEAWSVESPLFQEEKYQGENSRGKRHNSNNNNNNNVLWTIPYSKTPIKYSLIQTGVDDRTVTLAPPSSLVVGKEWNEPTEDTNDL